MDEGAKNDEPVVVSTTLEMIGFAELYVPWEEVSDPEGAMFGLYWSVQEMWSPTLAIPPEALVTVPVML